MAEFPHIFIQASTRESFETALADGRVSQHQIAFIEGTQEIWARGKYYPCPYTKEEIDEKIIKKIDDLELIATLDSEQVQIALGEITNTILTAATAEKAGLMTAEDRVNFEELCLLTYGSNTTLTMGGSTTSIEKGIENTVTVSWDVKFNGTTVTPTSVSVTKGSTSVSTSTTNKSITDKISDTTTYNTSIVYRGVTKTASRTYNAYYPKFYGGSAKTALVEADVTALTKQAITSSAAGTYSVTSTDNQYVWFCVPSSMNIAKVTLGGFEVPLEEPTTVAITGKGNYKCYRSSNPLSAGTRSFVIA